MLTQDVIDAAQAAARKWHVPASVSLAQYALESGWGKHIPAGSNNPFGYKAVNEPSVTVPTHEFENGRYVLVMAQFRKFASIADAFDAHGRLLAESSRYVRARAAYPDPDDYAAALTGIYATDPRYGDKLQNIMDDSNLYQYDVE